MFRSNCREEFWGKGVLRNSCPLTVTAETFKKVLKKYLWSLHTYNLTKNELFALIFQGFWSVFKTAAFSKHLIVTLYLCLWSFIFVEKLIFFYFQVFLFYSFKRHYIGFFENTIVYSCMWSTSVNMFSENGGRLPSLW